MDIATVNGVLVVAKVSRCLKTIECNEGVQIHMLEAPMSVISQNYRWLKIDCVGRLLLGLFPVASVYPKI